MSATAKAGSCVLLTLAGLLLAACGGGGAGVEGTVTVGGEAAAGITVKLLPGDEASGAAGPAVTGDVEATVTATTDEAGRFSLEADPGRYSLSADVEMEGTGGCTALFPGVAVEEGSTTQADLDLPAEPPSGGITFVDPFWFACFEG
jgi:hypothetical protein